MHGDQRVIKLGGDDAFKGRRFRNPAGAGYGGFRPGELPAHIVGHQPADKSHEQTQKQILFANHFVVHRKDVLAPKTQLFVVCCHIFLQW